MASHLTHRHKRKIHVSRYLAVSALLFGGLMIAARLLVGGYASHTLPYATEMGNDSLLQATNNHRARHGAGLLTINPKLTHAAQEKANDMRARDYWSHNTPEGNPPWVFIEKVGYSYVKAGENLAYGFQTSRAAIRGWMNSESHRENMLDPNYTEVGFGFANSNDYQSHGEQTIVVAMYGTPSALEAQHPTQTTIAGLQNTTSPMDPSLPSYSVSPQPVTRGQFTSPEATQAKSVSRLMAVWGVTLPLSTTVILVIVTALLTLYVSKHLYAIKRIAVHGERFILHHPLLDICVVSLALALYYAGSTAGFIQ